MAPLSATLGVVRPGWRSAGIQMELGLAFFSRWAVASLACCLGVLGACSPTFNWRDLRPEGAPLQALMPCKPETATRAVPMLGQSTDLHMHSCETGGLTFAVAWAEIGDAARAGEALAQWQTASLAAIKVAPDAATPWPLSIAGASMARGVNAQGSNHRGEPWLTQAAYFAQGTRVYQAAVYGPKISSEVHAAFFEGLSLP